MFERYTEQARRALFHARYEAGAIGGRTIESEHLLLGLLRERNGLTSRLFERHQISYLSILGEVRSTTVERDWVETSVEIPFGAESKRVLQAAAMEADRLGHKHIGTEHLLLAVLGEPHSRVTLLLKLYGMELDLVRQEVALTGKENQE